MDCGLPIKYFKFTFAAKYTLILLSASHVHTIHVYCRFLINYLNCLFKEVCLSVIYYNNTSYIVRN